MITSNSGELTLLRLQALLDAGLPTDAALSLVADETEQLEARIRTRMNALLAVATEYGGSVALGLEALRLNIQNSHELKQAAMLAWRMPQITSRLILGLPIALVLLVQTLGLNVLGLALRQPAVAVSLAIGSALMLANYRFAKNKLRALEAQVEALIETSDGFDEMLVRLSAGAPPVFEDSSAPHDDPHDETSSAAELLALLQLAEEYGLATSAFIKTASDLKHARAVNDVKLKISTLQTRLIAPLALLSLPVMTFLAIIPVVMTLITN